jgi:hypothetical protein
MTGREARFLSKTVGTLVFVALPLVAQPPGKIRPTAVVTAVPPGGARGRGDGGVVEPRRGQ